MADWKQITARIRRARTSKDPAGQLTNLFEKTRDAMVAFELGKHFEASAQKVEAVKWYAAAAERFRRADWKAKAQEALSRLDAAVPENAELPTVTSTEPEATSVVTVVSGESGFPMEHNAVAIESALAVSSEIQSASVEVPAAAAPAPSGRGRSRRGRRGGRNRQRGSARGATNGAMQSAPPLSHEPPLPRAPQEAQAEGLEPSRHREIPSFPAGPSPDRELPGPRGRSGDPGLSSRLSLLEMQFRRLLTCPPTRLDHADKAPVGPGVFVLTDEEMATYYYVEACDTLRVAIGQLVRAGSSRRGNPAVKLRLAEHLGITEARVGKYLTDHCVVRWLQLDEGATYLAHYAIAVLRPVLND